ncbi:MAG: PH domain-containing protein [Pseudomonadota bacterium]|nr:PH domain-containing protein [Pseudomonadota bacterium]
MIAAFGLGVLLLLGWYITTRADELQISSGKILWVHGIVSKTYVEIDIQQVRTVRVHQNFTQRIFRSGLLEVFTAGDKPEIVIRGLPYTTRIREIIDEQKTYDVDYPQIER